MTSRLARTGLALAAAATLTAGLATPASAAPAPKPFPDCSVGWACVFDLSRPVAEFAAVPSGQCATFGRQFNQIDNNTEHYQRVWTNANCTGTNVLIRYYEKRGFDMILRSVGGY
ncbi:hypothetical protein N8J89_23355 [Crossiella sp. CA-258035]|uniref:hypothetical protein n=1 Tax=Crossiella sp. CA-258035 TaxID=2981138 RepID=UPI0024BC2FA7|nr:hypothetical protein [Crossiella sp. CA-258035]WHT16069.1 hypothetical protein N8J89_23355 [Crossiella sp. CA-258035]